QTYQRKLAKQLVKVQKMKIEHQEMLIQSNIQVIEDERKQFASNLHDVIGAQVAITKITLSSTEELEESNQQTVERTMEMLDEISTSIRSISYNIMPPVLIKLGLSKAIEEYLKKLPDSGIRARLDSMIGDKRFQPSTELHAFRIFQEAISNALKHANCTEISIELKPFRNASFELIISDNGKGFQKTTNRGTGLLNMEHRAALMHFDVDMSSKRSGTIIYLSPKSIAE
ncbi:MAG: sensor histidine kinase, partial [Crocinitomicaceae bacterium]